MRLVSLAGIDKISNTDLVVRKKALEKISIHNCKFSSCSKQVIFKNLGMSLDKGL
jgi:hypothetical protein